MNKLMAVLLLFLYVVSLNAQELSGVAVWVPESIAANNSNKTDRAYTEMLRRSDTPWDANQCRRGQEAYQVIAAPANKGRVWKVYDVVMNTYHVPECLPKRIAVWTNDIDNVNVKMIQFTNFSQAAAAYGIEPDTNRIIQLPAMTNRWTDEIPSIVVGLEHDLHMANTNKATEVLLDLFSKPDTPENREWVNNGWQTYEKIANTNITWDLWRQSRSAMGLYCTPVECLLDRFAAYDALFNSANAKFDETTHFNGVLMKYGLRKRE